MSEHIDNFLDFFRKKISNKIDESEEIKSFFEKKFNLFFQNSQFKYNNGILYIDCSPIIKNEILIKKRNILKEIEPILLKYNKKIIDIK